MAKIKISFIATVFNEEENIEVLMDSLLSQSVLPDEIIIVDGGSTDATILRIKNYESRIKEKFCFKLLVKKGNRSVGRNEAVRNAKGDIIVCSDAGCRLDSEWTKRISRPFISKDVDVVAGYYKGKASSVFQKCLVPYVLVMPDRINPDKFLPATRSMAFRKSVWEKVKGFPEEYSHNEDYVFAKRIKKKGFRIKFEEGAIVEWMPPSSLYRAYIMFMRFALGDMEAGILRPKVILIFLRYLFAILVLVYVIIKGDTAWVWGLAILFAIYIIWAIAKNYKYVKHLKAIFILPVIQIVSDIAVLAGSLLGLIRIWDTKKTR